MFLLKFSLKTDALHCHAASNMERRGATHFPFLLRRGSDSSQKHFQTESSIMEVTENLLLEASPLWTEFSTTKLSSPSDWMCWLMLIRSFCRESMVWEVLVPNMGGYQNGPWRGAEFSSDGACFDRF